MSPSVELMGSLAFAFSAGMATFFAPCAYPLLPGYVGYYVSTVSPDGPAEGDSTPVGGALVRGVAASVGVLAVFGALTAVVFSLGQTVVAHVELLEPVIGGLLVVLGALTLADRLPEWHLALPKRRTTVSGFVLFGAVYAVAASGCVVPVFSAVLLRALSVSGAAGAAIVLAYAAGLGVLMVGVTVVTAFGVRVGTGLMGYLDWVTRAAGVVMILAGLGQLYLSIFVLHVL